MGTRMTVTVMVTNVDEAGTVTLSTLQPVDGIDVDCHPHRYRPLTMGTPRVLWLGTSAWKWAKSLNRRAPTPTLTATLRPRTAHGDDLDHYLRATATYTDPRGSGQDRDGGYRRIRCWRSRSTNNPPVFRNADDEDHNTYGHQTREVAENTLRARPWETRLWPTGRRGRRADLHA